MHVELFHRIEILMGNVFETAVSVDSSQYFRQHQSKIFRLTNRMGYSECVAASLQLPNLRYHHVSSGPNKYRCLYKQNNCQLEISYTAMSHKNSMHFQYDQTTIWSLYNYPLIEFYHRKNFHGTRQTETIFNDLAYCWFLWTPKWNLQTVCAMVEKYLKMYDTSHDDHKIDDSKWKEAWFVALIHSNHRW